MTGVCCINIPTYYIWIGEIMTFLNNVNKNQFLYYWSQCKCSYNTIVWYELMLSCVIPISSSSSTTLAEAKRGWRRVHCPHLLSLLTRLSFATCGEGCFEAEAASVWSKNKFTFICIMTNYIPTYVKKISPPPVPLSFLYKTSK